MQFRQGDVLIEKVSDKVTDKPASQNPPTLAEGEVSGHFHRVFGDDVTMYVDDEVMSRQANRTGLNPYSATLEVRSEAKLRHVNRDGSNTGEHDPIDLVSGMYHVINQREYDPEAERRAAD